jgi:hypothetical protein
MRSQLQSAVVQSTVIIVLSMILTHEINRNAYDSIWEDPVLKNLTSVFTNSTNISNTTSTPVSNSTISRNGTASSVGEASEPFYLKSLPRDVFIQVLLFPLAYYWQLLLERLFPTRPRGVEVSYEKNEKSGIDGNEDREEEVVKRWIAQGKVRRSTVSWWNTFVKWVLNLTVGRVWHCALWHFLDGCVRWRSFKVIMNGIVSVRSKFAFTIQHSWIRSSRD